MLSIAMLLAIACSAFSCRKNEAATTTPTTINAITVYCSVDETYAKPILQTFTDRTDLELSVQFDTEAGKTTGLVNRIISESKAGRPRADVFWSGEVFNTILLARQGLLAPCTSPSAADIPERYRDPQHRWTGYALRGRVLAFNDEKMGSLPRPKYWSDLAKPEFARHVAIANPLFGTTRGHFAAMFALWGPKQASEFLVGLRAGGAKILDGNSATIRAVAAGDVAMGATDTDDVWAALRGGKIVGFSFLDMGDGEGTLMIPCSVSLVNRGPNPEQGKKLVDYLLSAEVERWLAEGPARHIPVREALRKELGDAFELLPHSQISFDAVADSMDEAMSAVRNLLLP